MKKYILLIAILISNYTYAQLDIGVAGNVDTKNDNLKFNVAQKTVMYNSAIIGYANVCNLSKFESKKIEEKLFKNLQVVNLTENELGTLKKLFNQIISETESKNKFISKTECNLFEKEFKKIISAIDGNIKD